MEEPKRVSRSYQPHDDISQKPDMKVSVLRLSPKHVMAPERSPRSGNVARVEWKTVCTILDTRWE